MKIIGYTVGTPLPKPNFDQTDPKKGDYIKGDRSFLNIDDTLTNAGSPADAKATGDAISSIQEEYVPNTRKINNKALSGDISLNASDVSAVPTTRTINSKALSSNISLTASDVGAVSSSGQTASRVMISNADGNVAPSVITTTELGYLDGVTSSIQTQLDGKASQSDMGDRKYKTYYNLSQAGITGQKTTQEVFEAMPSMTILICSNTNTAENCITDIPTTYSMVEIAKIGSFGFAKASRINSTSQEFYMGSWHSSSGFAGWDKVLTTESKLVVDSQNYGAALPSTGVEGQIFFKKVT